jgi:DNA polymerase I-like protein with 3'-5' exonuclease and polymerase domains
MFNIHIVSILNDFCGSNLDPGSKSRQLVIKSPFRDDTHPSFTIYLDTNTAYDWGTGEYYDCADIVKKALGITYAEALKTLKAQYDVVPLSPNEEAEIQQRAHLQRYVDITQPYLAPEHVAALIARGISEQAITDKKFGYHPAGLPDVTQEELSELGITDDFIGRIVLPCHLNGQLGSVIGWDYLGKSDVKYVFPARWPRPITGTTGDDPLLVEGIFDLLVCEQAGLPAISGLSSSITETQKEFLRKLTHATILFDGDDSGEQAAEKLALELFPRAKVATLQRGDDPNSLYCRVGSEKFVSELQVLKKHARDPLKTRIQALDGVREQFEALDRVKEVAGLLTRLPKSEQEPHIDLIIKKVRGFGISKAAIRGQIRAIALERQHQERQLATDKATQLFEAAMARCTLFHDNEWKLYAQFEINGHCERYPLGSEAFKSDLNLLAFETSGSIPNSEVIRTVIAQLKGQARFHGKCVKLNNRVAERDEAFLYDLTNEDWSIVSITPVRWEIVHHPDPIFRRFQHQAPQAPPDREGNIDSFFDLIRVPDPHQELLLKVFMVYCLIPGVPMPILYVYGEKGSGKSTITKLIRVAIDPSSLESLGEPRDLETVRHQLHNHWLPLFDNINYMPHWFVRACCTASTGEGDDIRKKYTDDDSFIIKFQRPLIINAINRLATGYTDFQDRLLIIKLPRLDKACRKEEREIRKQFSAMRSQLIGGLLNTLSKAMALKPTIVVSELGRMADFTVWGCAIAEALGYSQDDFLQAYAENQNLVNYEVIEGHPVASCLLALIGKHAAEQWQGSATELFEELEDVAVELKIDTKQRVWPKAPNSLMRRLNELKSNLHDVGIIFDEIRTGEGTNRVKSIIVRKASSITPDSSESTEQTSENAPSMHGVTLQRCLASGIEPESTLDPESPLDVSSGVIAVDLETTGLDPLKEDIRLVSCASGASRQVFLSPEPIKHILADSSILKVFHNAAFDVCFLATKGYEVNNCACTMVMAQILDNNSGSHKLKDVVKHYLHKDLDKTYQDPHLWHGEITEAHREYAITDALVTYDLYHVLEQRIVEQNLQNVCDREMRALPSVIRLQTDGFYFDYQSWSADLAERLRAKEALEREIKTLLVSDINLASPVQLLACLKNRGYADLKDTSDNTLALIEDTIPDLQPVIKKLREWRELNKLVTTYGQKLLDTVAADGRIHPHFRLIGTVTGRMSCNGPNLQQVPPELKKYFKAPNGWKLIIADYSQIELRVAAELSRDKVMIEALHARDDLHAKTAQLVLRKAAISKGERQLAKGINFGLVYGMSAFGLHRTLKTGYGIDISNAESEQFRNRFLESYPGIRRWHEEQVSRHKISSRGGRSWSDLPKPRQSGWRHRLNYPVQATGAEGLKEALALLVDSLHDDWKLVNVIHDEVVLEVPEAEADRAAEFVQACMVDGMKCLLESVPVDVTITVANAWLTKTRNGK